MKGTGNVDTRTAIVKTLLIASAIGLIAAGCSSDDPIAEISTTAAQPTTTVGEATATPTTVPPTTTTTTQPTTTTLSEDELAELQYEEDVDLIKDLWRDASDAWSTGLEAGYAYTAKHNYGPSQCTVEDFTDYLDFREGTRIEFIVDQSTIERDDGWVVPGTGPGDGQVPSGRIYIMTVKQTFSDPGFDDQVSETESHARVEYHFASYFFACRDDT